MINVTVKIGSYTEMYTITGLYCPKCCKKTVWDGSIEDYYVGATFVCIDCRKAFHFMETQDHFNAVEQIKHELLEYQMNRKVLEALNEIDAALFSSDTFSSKEAVENFKAQLESWGMQLQVIEDGLDNEATSQKT